MDNDDAVEQLESVLDLDCILRWNFLNVEFQQPGLSFDLAQPEPDFGHKQLMTRESYYNHNQTLQFWPAQDVIFLVSMLTI